MFRLPTKSDLNYILRAAASVDEAVGGCIQVGTGNGHTLATIASCGLTSDYFDRFATVVADAHTTCGQAWIERRRIVVRDVETDVEFAPHRIDASSAGYRAVQSTPLVDTEFHTVGILSTYFPVPHHPTPASLAAIDRYCRLAALVVEVDMLHEAIADADRRLSIPARVLPGPVADAAGAARRLIASLEGRHHEAALRTATEYLEIVARYLRNIVHQTRGFTPPQRNPLLSLI